MNVRTYVASVLILAASIVLCSGPVRAQQTPIPRKHDPWAMFSPGAWKVVRVVTETFDQSGAVVSTGVNETKTTLKKVEDDGVTLEVEVAVWVAGKRLDPKPRTVKQGFHGETNGETATVKNLDPTEIVIEGRKIPCRVRQLLLTDPSKKLTRTVKVFYNDDVVPYVLRRESIVKEANKPSAVTRTTMTVDALKMPCEVQDRIQSAAHVRTVVERARGTTTILAYTSTDVPGGILNQRSKEEDAEGRLVRRSVLELTAFGLEPELEKRTGLFQRRPRPARYRKGIRRPPE